VCWGSQGERSHASVMVTALARQCVCWLRQQPGGDRRAERPGDLV